jgi:hypothetical protein
MGLPKLGDTGERGESNRGVVGGSRIAGQNKATPAQGPFRAEEVEYQEPVHESNVERFPVRQVTPELYF